LDFIAKPFGMLLMWLYELTKNYGAAIFLFAFVVKVVLLYFSAKSKKSMMRQTRFTPYLKELEARYEGNKQKYQEEVAKLYKEEGINPMGGCLWSLLPFPILLALYRAIRFPITIMMGVPAEAYEKIREVLTSLGYEAAAGARGQAYAQIYESQFITSHFDKFAGITEKLKTMDYSFLGLDLGVQPNFRFWEFSAENGSLWSQWGLFLIPVIAGVLSWVQSKISMSMSGPQDPQTASTNRTMTLMMPLMSLWIGFAMPGALGLYWIATSVFQILQDYILTKIFNKQLDAEDAERTERMRAREAELERKREETRRLREEGATVVNPNTSKRKMQKSERQKTLEGANKWENANRAKDAAEEPSRVGDRPYARGRAYRPDRFGSGEASAPTETAETAQPSDALPPLEEAPAPEEITMGENSIREGEIGSSDSEDNGE